MPNRRTLKERIRAGEAIRTIRLPMDASRVEVQETIRQGTGAPFDLLYIDAQHGPVSEWDIVRICSAAEEMGVPVQMRIRHLREVYLIGHYLDLGLFGIKVPEVEDEAAVVEAIQAFYFPPLGRRSWGGWVGYGIQERRDRLQYAKWWNENGILGCKIESVKAVLSVSQLAKPGLDYIDFGPADLSFSLENSAHPRLKTLEDCRAFVQAELADSHVGIL